MRSIFGKIGLIIFPTFSVCGLLYRAHVTRGVAQLCALAGLAGMVSIARRLVCSTVVTVIHASMPSGVSTVQWMSTLVNAGLVLQVGF